MTERMPIKEAKKKFIKRSFYCGVVAILVCWFMKLFGFELMGIDLNNKFFNDLSKFFENHYWLKQIYYSITLNIQLYLLTCIVNKEQGMKPLIYILKLFPITIALKVLCCVYSYEMGFLSPIIEIIYLMLATSKFKIKKIGRGILAILLLTLYQMISLNTRNIQLQSFAYTFVIVEILSIDLYILLYLSKEVSLMDEGTWIFFGFTAWLYRIAGFIVGLFTLHPIKKSREWYEKGKAKEDARKAKKATR